MSKKAFQKIKAGLDEAHERVSQGHVLLLAQEELDMVLRPMLQLKGYRLTSSGKIEKIKGYGLNASAKLKQRKSKKVKPVKRVP